MAAYRDVWEQSIYDPERFWGTAAEGIDWYEKPTVVLDRSGAPLYEWFADGVMNTCFNAVDRHVANGRADQLALIYDSPVTDTRATYTYANCSTRSRGSRVSWPDSASPRVTGSSSTCR